MKRRVIFMVIVLACVSTEIVFAAGHEYIGVKKCALCHKSESKGNQYGQWLSTKHAKAYETLATPQAQETAEKAGVSGDPQEAAACLKCHQTGFGADSSLLGSGFIKEDGVQCESCHGAGGDYAPLNVMKDKDKSIAAGLIMPTEDVCVKCHNAESPNFKGFNFKEYYPKISHPLKK
ncbi:MAG: cytochrome C554 [Candidatus Omnitrophica bacterium CG11_big_fil_rev_8_21_14_0_20_41_12]|nr:MAG: cytochrome C554 [Candidatus Omnitrophica bacterium CG11_big_fil_rev_8_21_14_0_20_41_12]